MLTGGDGGQGMAAIAKHAIATTSKILPGDIALSYKRPVRTRIRRIRRIKPRLPLG
jgi:hypothetical protein